MDDYYETDLYTVERCNKLRAAIPFMWKIYLDLPIGHPDEDAAQVALSSVRIDYENACENIARRVDPWFRVHQ